MIHLTKLEILLFKLIPNSILRRLVHRIPRFKFLRETLNTQTPISFEMFYNQLVIGKNRSVYWPVNSSSTVINYQNIFCGIETCPGFSPGNYIQALGKIYIGDYTQIGPNVGIISGNHDLYDNRKHISKDVKIGKYCWLGMGSVILPGVKLGDYTIVAAGSMVTKSFSGHCLIAGNPAKKIKDLDADKCIEHKSDFEYNGFIPNSKFEDFRRNNLNV